MQHAFASLLFGLAVLSQLLLSMQQASANDVQVRDDAQFIPNGVAIAPPLAQPKTAQKSESITGNPPPLTSSADPVFAKLHWKSGDALTGELLSATDQTLTWKSPLFVDPFVIDAAALSVVRFPDSAAAQPIHEPFRISMSNGDVLFGSLLAATETTILFTSQRHGRFELFRDQIETIKRIDTPELIFLGPRGVEGWINPVENQEGLQWQELSNGHLTTSQQDRGLLRKLSLPEKCEIEVILESSQMPSFILAFGNQRHSCLRIESWAEILVVLSRFQFVEVDSMQADTRRVHLNFYLDRKANRLSTYSAAGVKLAEIVDERGFLDPSGILFWNRGSDLTVNYLRVDRWNGELPQPLKIGQSRIQTLEGKVIYAKLPSFSENAQRITIEEGSQAHEVSIDQLMNIVIHDGEKKEPRPSPTHVSWKEGGYISGELVSIENQKLALKTSYSTSPITSSLEGIQRLTLPNSQDTPQHTDQLFFEGGSLRGNLVIDDATSQPIRWTPVGGKNASALSSQGDARFVRGTSGTSVSFDPAQWPDTLYLLNGDIIPCLFEHATEDTIFARNPFSPVKELPSRDVKAVEFSSAGRVVSSGFNDAGWKRVAGRPAKTENSITFQTNGSYGHESIFSGDIIKFRIKWSTQQFSQLILHLYGSRLAPNNDATSVQLRVNANRLWVEDYVSPQLEGGGFIIIQDVRSRPPEASRVIELNETEAEISVAIRDGKVHILINDQLVKSVELKNRRPKTKSLVLQAEINQITRSVPYGNNPLTQGLVIDQFEVRKANGSSVKQFIQDELRDKALLVPRFRRDNPATHVILAPNGDLLRGRLRGVDEHKIHMESQLEELSFPRERVGSVIWLHPELVNPHSLPEAQETVPRKAELQLRLGDGYFLSMDPEQVVGAELHGKAANLGHCTIPASAIKEVLLGDPTRSEITSYSNWIPKFAAEPNWDLPDEGSSGPAQELVGTIAPDFQLPTLDGTTFRLDDHPDKVIVLDFWASWCGPCIAALPDYIQATDNFAPEQVLFVAVNLQESSQIVRGFLREKGLSPQVALDESGGIAQRFRVSGIPHTVILSPGKVIEKVHIGYRQNAGEEMRHTIEKILDGSFERTPSAKPGKDENRPGKENPPVEDSPN